MIHRKLANIQETPTKNQDGKTKIANKGDFDQSCSRDQVLETETETKAKTNGCGCGLGFKCSGFGLDLPGLD